MQKIPGLIFSSRWFHEIVFVLFSVTYMKVYLDLSTVYAYKFSLPLDGFYHAIQAGNFGSFKPQVVRKCDKMFVSSFLYEAFQFFMIRIRFLRLSFILIIALAFITRERGKS